MLKDDKVRRISCTGIAQIVHVTHVNKDPPTDIAYNNIDEIKEKTAELSQVIQKIGEALYKQAPNPPAGGEKKGPEEGEYKEK